jgi:hypothetical protein
MTEPRSFSTLEMNILKAKGLTEAQLGELAAAGVASRDDFKTVGDPATLRQLLPSLPDEVAMQVMSWATGYAVAAAAAAAAAPVATGPVMLDSADVVYCVHCKAKQPKDYKSGDLCTSCGKQAEPVLSCFWCSASGPGKFCRSCGAEFLSVAELELGMLLKRDGVAKDEIPVKLRSMSSVDKEMLWGRVRKMR